jgi:putative PIN family toxin of toxin-antitoxin system
MIRAALDANVFISSLLLSGRSTNVHRCVDSGIAGAFVLLVPEPLFVELFRKVGEKHYLATRIGQEALGRLVAILLAVGEVVPSFDNPIPPVSRDEKDDYLLAYARIADADYLVTGDKDLLVLRDLFQWPAIRTPAEFVRELGLDASDESDEDESTPLGEPEDETI